MTRFRHGLVVGKFYPPHSGHHHLIDVAAARCDRLTVVVAPSSRESIPLDDRCAWLRARHPGVIVTGVYDDTPVDYHDPDIWEAHCRIFRDAIAAAAPKPTRPAENAGTSAGRNAETSAGPNAETADGPAPVAVDAVFSSEGYGDELARRFGAVHVAVDPGRRTRPVSGTAVRADPIGHWDDLGPGARAWFTRRVVVVGAESTGTTTMARALAEVFAARGGVWSRTRWIPEYGRDLTARKLDELRKARPEATIFDVEWGRDDFVEAATEQNRATGEAAREGSPVLFGDTDAFASSVWEERYLGSSSRNVRALATRPDLYLLTDHVGVPFEDDGLRDGEHIRAWMTGRFRESLAASPVPVIELRGAHGARLARAVSAVDDLLAGGWHLVAPLG